MAINERLIDTAVAASGDTGNAGEEGLILHLDANDVDSYDGDGDEWVDITNHEYTPATNVSEHFNTVTYAGQGSKLPVTGVGFTPDLVWIKCTDDTASHSLVDSVRGGDGTRMYSIFPDLTAAQNTTFNAVETIDSDGFTVFGDKLATNRATQEYVAWCFKAGGAPSGSDKVSIDGTSYSTMTAAGLTDGSADIVKLSINKDLGFSIAKYTGSGTASATVAHGLDTPPEMLIVKRLEDSEDWAVYHKGAESPPEDYVLILNETYAAGDNATRWNDTAPTSTVFTVGSSQAVNAAEEYIAYCFTSKRGVSKVGSYTGTGSSGNKVYTGFEPAFIMTKRSSTSGDDWNIIDNVRDTDTNKNAYLKANTAGIEVDSSSSITFNRDGFTLNGGSFNTSSQNHIYYAIAKNTNAGSLTPSTDGTEIETDLIFDPTKVNYYGNYAFEQNNTVWRGNSSKSNGQNEGEVYVNNYFESGDTGKYYFEVKCLESSSHGGVGFTDPTKYTGGDGANQTSFRNNQLWGLSAGGILTGGYASTTTFANSTNNTNEVTAIAIDVATRKVWMGRVLSGSITWYNSGDPSGGTNPLVTLPSNYNIYQPLAYDGSWSGSSARYAFWKIHTEAEASSLPTGFSYMTGAIKNADLELHLDAGSFDGSTNTPTTWTDSSGNSNDGTITGATFDGELGNYLNFDGSNDYIDCGSSSNIIPAGSNFTIEAWVSANNNTTSTYWSVVGSVQTGTPYGGFQIYNHHTSNNWGIALNKSGAWMSLDSGVDIEVSKWVHLAYTYDGSYMKLFVDGEERFSSSQSGSLQYAGNVNLEIGRNVSSYAPIKVGQVRAYSSALSQAQIRQNYNFTKPSYPNGYNGALGTGTTKPTWNTAGYFSFDGSNDVVNLPELAPNQVKTVSFWIKSTDSTADKQIFNMGTYSSYGWVGIRLNSGKLEAGYGSSNGGYLSGSAIKTNSNYNDGSWRHVVCTFTGTYGTNQTPNIYVDKVDVATSAVSPVYTGLHVTSGEGAIGYYGAQNVLYINAEISDFKIFDKVLTTGEIQSQFSIGYNGIG